MIRLTSNENLITKEVDYYEKETIGIEYGILLVIRYDT